VWGSPRYLNTETRAVDIHIATLKQKLEIDPENPQFLNSWVAGLISYRGLN